MPNNVTFSTSDPLNQGGMPLRRRDEPLFPQPPERQAHGESVLSRYHPDNNRRDGARTPTYTFRQRVHKLDFTLGWELEANHVPMRIPAGVKQISDGSVDDDGAEFIVMPAVTKSPRYVLGMLKDLVHAPGLNTNKSCGFHVHVSASNLSSLARMRQWAIATEHLALQVEDLAFKAVPDARHGNSYCHRIVPLSHGTAFSLNKYNNNRRYHWLNIVEMFRPAGIRTIEIRLLGNTHRWKYLLAWTLFSMELARRGWDVRNRPFDVAGHVDALGEILTKISKDIRPMEKKLEPIPQWVYDGLKTFGIEGNAWDRPLARLSETESDMRGLIRQPYSDNQPEIPSRNEDEESDECPCGCGNDGRCQSQEHEDGDCESNYCEYCHEDGRCDGVPDCERCIMNAHDNGEDCQRSRCGTCRPQPRTAPRAVPVSPIDMNGVTTGRITTNVSNIEIHPSNVTEPRNGLPTYPEELNLPMTDTERLASDARERAHSPQTGRALTVAEIERLNERGGR
jgi:hypothetical protein